MPPEDAQWFYDTFSYGDIVQVTATSTQLAPDDGYGDWNIPGTNGNKAARSI